MITNTTVSIYSNIKPLNYLKKFRNRLVSVIFNLFSFQSNGNFGDKENIGNGTFLNVETEDFQNLLVQAISYKLPQTQIEQLLKRGACASGSVENIVYPLHHAVDCDYVDCIYLLIQNGADVNAPDESNRTPLLLSASKGSYETMEALIQNGAHVNYCDTNDPKIPESVRQMGYLTYEPLNVAIENNCVQCVKLLLESGASANKKYYMGYEINLVPTKHLQCFELLLQHGADPNVFSRCGMTPLMKACKENRIDMVRLLLSFGADVHAKCPANFEQKTALYFAVENGGFEIVKLLTRNGANVWKETSSMHSPLHLGVLTGDAKMCQLLLSLDAEVDSVADDSRTPLMLAAKTSMLQEREIIMELLLQHGADPNAHACLANDLLPIHSAIVEYMRYNQRNLSKNIIKILLRYGAKVNIQTFMSCGQRDPFGILPYLTSSCDENIIEILANAAKQFHSRSILESDSLHHSQREYLYTHAISPRPLKYLVRLSLINHLGRYFTENVMCLPIPNIMKAYLKFENNL